MGYSSVCLKIIVLEYCALSNFISTCIYQFLHLTFHTFGNNLKAYFIMTSLIFFLSSRFATSDQMSHNFRVFSIKLAFWSVWCFLYMVPYSNYNKGLDFCLLACFTHSHYECSLSNHTTRDFHRIIVVSNNPVFWSEGILNFIPIFPV